MNQTLIEVYQDTIRQIRKNDHLRNSAFESVMDSVVCTEWDKIDRRFLPKYFESTEVIVTKQRTFEAAQQVREEDKSDYICVHNFANAFYHGGGVALGYTAQEESLCRCSTLDAVLGGSYRLANDYYGKNRHESDFKGPDLLIYSPHITIFKTDTAIPETMPESKWFNVDIITMAAPDLRKHKISDNELQEIHFRRANLLLNIAAQKRNDILVLGAFGCGAFQNNPEVVAQAWKASTQLYRHRFKKIIFAVYCSENAENYKIFHKYFAP